MKERDMILNEMKKFMYDQKLEDLNVHSRQYLSSVLFSKYENNEEVKQPYTVIYGDYNKLNDINRKYGDLMGDRAMQTATRIIKETLPPNAQISRIGGDEFLFIVEGITEQEAQKYIDKVQENLNSSKNRPYNLTMEMAAVDSTHAKGINEMYQKAEEIANDRKNKSRQKTDGTKEEILMDKLEKSIKNYLSFFRFPKDFDFQSEYTKDILKKTMQTSINMLQKKEQIKKEEILNLNTPVISQGKAGKIDSILVGNKDEKSVKENDLKVVYNSLIREPVSKQLTRRYFEEFMEKNKNNQMVNVPQSKGMRGLQNFFMKIKQRLMPPKEVNNDEFKMMFVTTTFMKLSNSENGHLKTDQSLKEIPNQLKKNLSKYMAFTEDVTQMNNKNMVLDVGAGNFLVIYDKDINLENDQLQDVIKNVNNNLDTLQISAYKTKENLSLSEMSAFIKKADESEQLKEQKTKMKLEKFLMPETQKALDIALEEPINFYLKNFKDTQSMEAKMAFTEMITRGVSKAVVDEFEKQQKEEKADIQNEKQNVNEVQIMMNKSNERQNKREDDFER